MFERYIICRQFGAEVRLLNPAAGGVAWVNYTKELASQPDHWYLPLVAYSSASHLLLATYRLPLNPHHLLLTTLSLLPTTYHLTPHSLPPTTCQLHLTLLLTIHRYIGQMENESNPAAHIENTGPEIWAQSAGQADYSPSQQP